MVNGFSRNYSELWAGVNDPVVRSLKAHNAVWARTGIRINMGHVKRTFPAHTPTRPASFCAQNYQILAFSEPHEFKF